jgi:hypothetical protein
MASALYKSSLVKIKQYKRISLSRTDDHAAERDHKRPARWKAEPIPRSIIFDTTMPVVQLSAFHPRHLSTSNWTNPLDIVELLEGLPFVPRQLAHEPSLNSFSRQWFAQWPHSAQAEVQRYVVIGFSCFRPCTVVQLAFLTKWYDGNVLARRFCGQDCHCSCGWPLRKPSARGNRG